MRLIRTVTVVMLFLRHATASSSMIYKKSSHVVISFVSSHGSCSRHRTMVNLHGPTLLSSLRQYRSTLPQQPHQHQRGSSEMQQEATTRPSMVTSEEPPPNPLTLLEEDELQRQTEVVRMLETGPFFIVAVVMALAGNLSLSSFSSITSICCTFSCPFATTTAD